MSEERPRNLLRYLRALGWLVGALLLLLGAWSLLYGMLLTGLFLLVSALVWADLGKPWVRVVQWALLVLLLLPAAAAWKTPLREYAAATADLGHRRADLGTTDLLGIWGLNLLMGAGGHAAGLPEVARETWLLAVPTDQVRVRASDFAMRSPKVRGAVAQMAAQARQRGPGPLRPQRITWSSYATDSPRVSLALNCPLELRGEAVEVAGVLFLSLTAACHVAYPQRAQLTLGRVDDTVLRVDEGLLWELQERGWLHPYDMVYTWQTRADDPVLQDESAWLGWRERMLFET